MSEAVMSDIDAAEAAFVAGDMELAENLCRPMLEDRAKQAFACHLLGAIALRRGDARRAVEMIERALAAGLNDPAVLNNCGEAYRQLGRLDDAYARFETALKMDNTKAHPHLNMGLVMRGLGRAPEAEHFFRNALSLNPGMARAHYELGELYREEGHRTEAEREYREAILQGEGGDGKALERSFLARIRLGSLLVERGAPQEAVSVINVVLERAENPFAHFEIAKAKFELAWEREAEAHYLRSTVLEPGLGLHRPARSASVQTSLLKDWCESGHGRYTVLARSQWLALPPLSVIPPTEKKGFALDNPASPELACASIQNAEVLPRDFIAISEGRIFIAAVANWAQHYPQKGYFARHGSDDLRLLVDLPVQVQEYPDPCILLGGSGDLYAWMFEALARLWIIEQMPALSDLPLIVPPDLPEARLAMLERFDVPRERLLPLPNDNTLRTGELHIPTLLVTGDWISPVALQYLRRHLRVASTKPIRRLYLSRSAFPHRRLANEEDILNVLDRYGFEPIQLAGLEPLRLMAQISEAQAVLGIDDEVLASLTVAPQSARIGVITTGGMYRPRAHFISGQLAQSITYLVGETVFESNPKHELCDVVLPLATLELFLKQSGLDAA